MFVAEAHSFKQQARLAITLAWVAGYTNIVSILTCGTVTSHVSGTTSTLGRDLVEGSWRSAAFGLFLLVTFLSGAALSGFCTELGRRRGWESIYVLPMAMQALLLAAFAFGVELHDPTRIATADEPAARLTESGMAMYWMTGLACCAMGLQNATITRISSGVIRTTHVTGVLTDLGTELVQFLWHLVDQRRNFPPGNVRSLIRDLQTHSTSRRLALLASIVGSFALGAGLGTLMYDRLPHPAMAPPVLFLVWIIYQDIRRPIAEIGPSDIVSKSLNLPDGLGVFHLRKDADRKGAIHRMPNLAAWSERLPKGTHIIILDLTEVVALDANSAFELRALQRRFLLEGRHILLAGITPEQFAQLRDASNLTGELFSLESVCPDLELAIARGLNLLNERHVA